MCRVRRVLPMAFVLAIFLGAQVAQAAIVTGRFSFGGFISRENLLNTGDNASENDFQTWSSRMYLRVQKLGHFDFTADLRDKHDFFEKLDAERLALTGQNDFQIRELYLKYQDPNRTPYAALGRFALFDAGSVYCDGADVGAHWGSFRLGAFGGHNPKRPELAYLQSDTPDVNYGAYLSYLSPDLSSGRFLNGSHAFVTNSINGFTTREYFYSHLIYQSDPRTRLISNVFLDFIPRVYVQNGDVLFQKGLSEHIDATLLLTAVDAIAYGWSRGVLENLPSSPYDEVALQARYATDVASQWLGEIRWGQRAYDGTNREEAKIGYYIGKLDSSKIDVTAYAGYLQEFVSQGPEINVEMNYFSRAWEFDLYLQSAVEQRFNGIVNLPSVLHPFTTSLAVSNMLNRAVFSTVSIEYAEDEMAQIYSAFFKLTYRFGPLDLAPIREHAPRMKSL